MMITFLHPLYLLLVPVIALVWATSGRARGRTHLALRTLLFLVLVLSLSQPVLLRSDPSTFHVVVADFSASVDLPARRVEQQTIRGIQRQVGTGTRISLVVLPDQAGRDWTTGIDISRFHRVVEIHDAQSASPLGSALTAAARCVPAGGNGLIHLLTDGRSTDRRWAPDVQDIIERGIRVNTYDLGSDPRDVYPTRLAAEGLLRVGQTARISVEVEGTSTSVRVRLRDQGGEEIAMSPPVAIEEHGRVSLTFEPKVAGYLDITAEVVADPDDPIPENNQLTQTFAIQDGLRVLYVGARIQNASAPLGALLGKGFSIVDASRWALGPETDLSAYDLVLLDDLPASKLPAAFQDHLVQAVTHDGMGLVFSGGKAAFGTGGYEGTPIAKALPVDLLQRTEKRDPSTALAVIIDTSGSMAGTRIELAKQVARLAIRRLKAHDRVGIVEFYGNKHWALPMQSAANKVTIDRAIGRMQAIGGTVLLPALEEAYYGLKNVETRYKHIVIITDAGVESADYETLIRQIARDGINVSTVLTGAQAHNQLMIDMASWGKGRFYSVVDRYNLPELILKQPSTMKLATYKTGTFNVRSRGGAGWWSDIDRWAMPAIAGYVETTARPGAETLIEVASTEDPILASWRYGLGRVTAFMTEPVGEGTQSWKDWPDYGRLLARMTTRTADDSRLFDYKITRHDHLLDVIARRDSRDETLMPATMVIDAPAGPRPLTFAEDAPGYFSATIAIDPAAQIRLLAAGHTPSTPNLDRQSTRLVSSPSDDISPELQADRQRGLDLEGLANATGGTYVDPGALAAGELTKWTPAPAAGALAAWQLRPLFLVIGLASFVVEIVYRRGPGASWRFF